MNQKGFALLSFIFLTVFVLVIIGVSIFFKGNVDLKQSTVLIEGNKAFYLAESGIAAAVAQLRLNSVKYDPIAGNLSASNYSVVFSTTPTLSCPNLSPNLVEAIAVGTYKGYKGDVRKRLRVEITIESPGDYFAASGGNLKIAYGSQLAAAKIYGKDLTFLTGSGPATTVKDVAYFSSITGFDPSYLSPGGSVQECATEPSLPVLNAARLNDYQNVASAGIADGIITSGALGASGGIISAPDNGNEVYYCNGDLRIQGTIENDNTFIVVVNGNIYVEGDLTYGNGNSLVGLISTKDVILNSNSQPGNWNVNALVIAPNGELRAEGTPDNDSLTFNGGFLTGKGTNLANVFQGSRTYTYNNSSRLSRLPLMTYISKWQELPPPPPDVICP